MRTLKSPNPVLQGLHDPNRACILKDVQAVQAQIAP
jgi:hypothetical protein